MFKFITCWVEVFNTVKFSVTYYCGFAGVGAMAKFLPGIGGHLMIFQRMAEVFGPSIGQIPIGPLGIPIRDLTGPYGGGDVVKTPQKPTDGGPPRKRPRRDRSPTKVPVREPKKPDRDDSPEKEKKRYRRRQGRDAGRWYIRSGRNRYSLFGGSVAV